MCLSVEEFETFYALKKSHLADKFTDRFLSFFLRLCTFFFPENPNLEVTGTPKQAFVYA